MTSLPALLREPLMEARREASRRTTSVHVGVFVVALLVSVGVAWFTVSGRAAAAQEWRWWSLGYQLAAVVMGFVLWSFGRALRELRRRKAQWRHLVLRERLAIAALNGMPDKALERLSERTGLEFVTPSGGSRDDRR